MERTNRRFFAINRVNDFGGLFLNLASQKQRRNCCLARLWENSELIRDD